MTTEQLVLTSLWTGRLRARTYAELGFVTGLSRRDVEATVNSLRRQGWPVRAAERRMRQAEARVEEPSIWSAA